MKAVKSWLICVLSASFAFGEMSIDCEYPGGNVRVDKIDEANGVVAVRPDLRDTRGYWFYWDFTLRGAAGRKLHFQFPKGDYLSSLGPAISRDGGKTWRWLNADGKRHEPNNAFDYVFAADENETRFATSIPYLQKDWDAASARWRGKEGVKFDVLCKSQSGRRDTEMLRITCRSGKAKWLFAFTARHHACEASANPVMEGIIDEILSDSPEGRWIRDNADCVFVPFMDKDGVEDGDQGKNRWPYDHNRDYLKDRYSSVKALKKLVLDESAGKRLVFIDLHSPHVRSHPNCPEQDQAFSFGCRDKALNARWNKFRANWIAAQRGGVLVYDGGYDIFGGTGYSAVMEKQWVAGFMSSDAWARTLPNCYFATCCEFGYSLCGGIYSQPAARELGHSLLKAAAQAALSPDPACALVGSETGGIVLFDASSADASRLSAQNGATFTLADGLLTVKTPPSEQYPGVCIAGKWDLSRYGRIEVEFVNGGINGKYTLRLLNPGGDPGRQKGSMVYKLPIRFEKHAVLGADMVPRNPQLDAIAGRLKPLRVWALPYAAGVPYEMYKGRHSAPQSGIGQLDPECVVQVAVYINQPKLPHTWSVKRVVAKEEAKSLTTGTVQAWTKLSEKEFFPFLDKYGQFRHKEWPDKVHSDADFAVQRAKEEKDLAAHPGPKGWDRWGGWADGPQLPKTGGFSTTKWKGKWWIVDPDGHLWWSHGPVRVLPSSAMTPLATPAGDRSGWFAELPKRDDPVFGIFYETRDELLWPYYGKRGIDKVYDFSAANIRRKYGEKWFETWADLAHRRLRSWSCNTIANSSDKRICLMDRTPYTERFEIHARPIAGHKGGWWEFCDPFDPSFRAEARRMTEVYKAEIDDPWCFGFFVDNEHHWGAAHSFGVSTLKSPADQPCKAVFRDRLKTKYGTVAKLNAAWGMAYKDWDDFLRVTKEPKSFKGAKADLEAFSSEIAENYFRIIREELKRANPGKLYLGCRWAGGAPAFTVKAAAKYCDVLSYNVYRKEMSEFKLPEGIDAPVMIGEFHFGALDRGPFCPGLILLRDQKHRAETYKEYVRTSLEHPQIVGVHWHQFSDQATSGRFDGENMQVGWTDVCDTPYWDTVKAVREIGARIYEIRSGSAP